MIPKVKPDDIVKLSHIFKNAITVCGVLATGSFVALVVGFFAGWTTPDFYIVFGCTFLVCISGVFTFGILYFGKNERKGIRTNREEEKTLDIKYLQAYNEYMKIMFENGQQPLEFQAFKEQNE